MRWGELGGKGGEREQALYTYEVIGVTKSLISDVWPLHTARVEVRGGIGKIRGEGDYVMVGLCALWMATVIEKYHICGIE